MPGFREQMATRMAFFVVGLSMGAWAPLVPLAKSRLGVDEGGLGLLLLCLGFGSILGMPLSGVWAARFGCRAVILAAALVCCAALPAMAWANEIPLLAVALFAFGASIGTMDVTMNIQAVIVERASGRAMMSGFHGLYSVGGIAGAGGVIGLLALKLSPLVATLVLVVLVAALLILFAKGLLPYGSEEESIAFVLPRGRVLLIGALCFILFLAEGSVLDWGAVYLGSVRNVDETRAALGYVAFAVMMTLGRLTGDAIVRALGRSRTVFLGALVAAAGYLVVVLVPSWLATIAGFALVGAGAANVVPVLFSAAGNQKSMPSNLAIAAVTTMGYAGILVGPVLIGFLAQAATLPLAISLIAVLLLVAAACAKPATRIDG